MDLEKKVICFAIVTFGLLSACSKQPAIQKSSKSPEPVRANRAGDLQVKVIVSAKLEFITEWLHTPSSNSPHIEGIKKVVADQTFHAAFLVTGFTGDAEGQFRFSVGWELTKPDGSSMFGQEDYASGQGEMPDKPVFVMADPALDLTLETDDPHGLYALKATATDLVSGTRVSGTYQFEFVQ